jgi:hypothetical protein
VLDGDDLQRQIDLLAAESLVIGFGRDRDLRRHRVAHVFADQQLVEAFQLSIAEAQGRLDLERLFGELRDLLAVVGGPQRRGDEMPRLDRPLVLFERAVAGEQFVQAALHLRVGILVHRAIDLDALPSRHVELRPHLNVELEHHRPFVGQLDRVHIKIRLADRRELMVVRHLRQAVHQELALDLVGDVLLEARLDQLPRRSARAKTRQLGLRH